jgi:hypothetical protein
MTFAGIAAHLAGATAGLAIALIGEAFSFVAAGLGFGFSAVMIWLIRTSLLPQHAREKHEASEATGVMSRTAVRMLVWLTVAFTFVTALFLPFVAEHVARHLDCSWLNRWIAKPEDASFAGLIVLLGITGAGLFLGMLIAGQLARLAHWRLLPVLMFAVWGAAIWCLGQTNTYLPAALLCFSAGCATGLITIPSDARLQHEVTGKEHGRVFARRLALSNVAFLLGLAMNLDGRLLRVFGSGTLLQYLGVGSIAIAALFWLLASRTLKGRWGQPAMAEVEAVPAGR